MAGQRRMRGKNSRNGCRVPREEPVWWYGETRQITARALEPLARLYGAIAVSRFTDTLPYRSKLPVICIGNFTAGGTGKTPFAISIAERLKAMGERPVFLTRGYGGSAKGPLWVDGQRHTARETGDEPLLLVRTAPTLIARNRRAGAAYIETHGDKASVIVMDDGLQNPSLAKDLTLVVVDAKRGLGNERVIPAGPLRAPLDFQLRLANVIVLNDSATAVQRFAAFEQRLRRAYQGPIIQASLEPARDAEWLKGAEVSAYAGIANPQRFFDFLQWLGASVSARTVFRDHQQLTEADARRLLAGAEASGLLLVTTEKDWARLPASGTGALAALKAKSRVLAVRSAVEPQDEPKLEALLRNALAQHRAGRSGL